MTPSKTPINYFDRKTPVSPPPSVDVKTTHIMKLLSFKQRQHETSITQNARLKTFTPLTTTITLQPTIRPAHHSSSTTRSVSDLMTLA